jgi:hypothetical protein
MREEELSREEAGRVERSRVVSMVAWNSKAK